MKISLEFDTAKPDHREILKAILFRELVPAEQQAQQKAPAKKQQKKKAANDNKRAEKAGGQPTVEAVRQALQAVTEKKNIKVARDLLKQFDANRVSEIKKSDYAVFVEACEEAIKA